MEEHIIVLNMHHCTNKPKRKPESTALKLLAVSGAFLTGLLVGCALSASPSTPCASPQEAPSPQESHLQEELAELQPALEFEQEFEQEPEPVATYLGNYRITAYCACEKCCGVRDRPVAEDGYVIVRGAQGTELVNHVSVACNLPFGTKLQIDGLDGTFVVQDRTANWIQERYDGMIIDIYCDTHEGCYEYLSGMPEYMEVYQLDD